MTQNNVTELDEAKKRIVELEQRLSWWLSAEREVQCEYLHAEGESCCNCVILARVPFQEREIYAKTLPRTFGCFEVDREVGQ